MFFVGQACHQPILEGLNRHFKATAYFPLSSAVNLECWDSNRGQLGVEASFLTIVLCGPYTFD